MRALLTLAPVIALVAATPAMAADFTFTGPLSIPAVLAVGPVLPFPITFNVSGLGKVTDVNLTLSGLSHSYSDDLVLALVSPSQRAVLLMNNAGGNANWSNATLTFDQQAGGAIANGSGPYGGNSGTIPSGSYKPSTYDTGPVLSFLIGGNDLGLFDGEDANGTWGLYMLDDKILDRGGFDSVTLSLTTAAVPEPASWAMMIGGFALLGGALRARRTARLQPA